MPTSLFEFIFIIFLLGINGLLAMSELALVSARKARLRQWAEEGNKAAARALQLSNSPNELLSTIQVGITLVGILAGAVAGATIADDLSEVIATIPVLANYADAAAMGVVVTAVTYLSLIIGELVPKRFALLAPEKVACYAAVPLHYFSKVTKPIVILLTASSNLVFRLAGIKEDNQPSVTEAEIRMMMDQATESGIFEEIEQEIIASVMRLSDRKVNSIMTPRNEIVWLNLSDSLDDNVQKVRNTPHTNFIVAEEKLDKIIGVVDRWDVINRALDKQPIDFRVMMRQPVYVPESTSALELLKRFREAKEHLAVIIDEYGGLVGIVTGDDLFESIVGELPLQGQIPKWEILQREDGSWLMDGQVPIDDFKDLLNISEFPEYESNRFNTLAGLILAHLESVPQPGDKLTINDLELEIVDMDRYRIDKVLVKRT